MDARLIVFCLCLTATAVFAQAPPKVGDVAFSSDFEKQTDRDAWPKHPLAQWVTVEGHGQCLQFTVPPDQLEMTNMISIPIDLTPYRGYTLLFECRAKADNVSKPPANYLGVKYMLHYVSPAEGGFWTNQNDVYGTFDWKPLQFSTRIAPDATTGELTLGLQNCSGAVTFDDLKVTVAKLPPPPRPKPMLNPPPAFRGHDLPRLRGVMSPNTFKEEDFRILGQEWNANVIRWQMTRNWGQSGTERDLVEYDKWFNAELEDLDKVLDAARRYGLKVVVDMHSPPGGRYANKDLAIFNEKLYQDHWLALWEQMARRYKGNPAVWGYDLINEPVQNLPSRDGVADYFEGQVRVAKAIRAIDPVMPIFIESAQWDSSQGYKEMQPVNLPNMIYQVHMYDPGEFTHQGVRGPTPPITYPGKISGVEWNKDQIRKNLQPVRDFQLAYNTHIYVGEFSAIRWAPGAEKYLSDCIDVFEEYGWDWTFHAYREWDGWSLEHGPDKDDSKPTTEPTIRKQAVLNWFAKNVKPKY